MDNEPESASQNTNKEGRETFDLKWGIYIDITYCKSIHGILTAAITVKTQQLTELSMNTFALSTGRLQYNVKRWG